MKEYEDMNLEEKVNYAVGVLTLSIGEGKFRQGVSKILQMTMKEAYYRGMEAQKNREKK